LKLYLANRMRGLPHLNWDWFIENARTLRAKGHEVVNPTEIDEEAGVVFVEYDTDGSISDVRLTPKYNYDEVMRRDLDAVAECDGIVMGPDWAKSEGARLERETAKAHGLTIYYGVGVVPDVTVPDIAGRDLLYPILDQVDQLRHEQRWGWTPTKIHLNVGGTTNSEAVAEAVRAQLAPRDTDEVRVTDPETGGAKGQKLAQLGAVDPAALMRLAEVAGFGALKYDRLNFAKGYAWSLSFDAMQRHLLAFWAGEATDPESGFPHLAHAAWHCLTLLTFMERELGTDDRISNLPHLRAS
jgi:hypothetical protein